VGTRRRLFQFFIYYCLLISLTTYLGTDNAPGGRDNAGMFLTRHVAENDCLLYVRLLAIPISPRPFFCYDFSNLNTATLVFFQRQTVVLINARAVVKISIMCTGRTASLSFIYYVIR